MGGGFGYTVLDMSAAADHHAREEENAMGGAGGVGVGETETSAKARGLHHAESLADDAVRDVHSGLGSMRVGSDAGRQSTESRGRQSGGEGDVVATPNVGNNVAKSSRGVVVGEEGDERSVGAHSGVGEERGQGPGAHGAGRELFAHTEVLRARCPYVKALLDSGMAEARKHGVWRFLLCVGLFLSLPSLPSLPLLVPCLSLSVSLKKGVGYPWGRKGAIRAH